MCFRNFPGTMASPITALATLARTARLVNPSDFDRLIVRHRAISEAEQNLARILDKMAQDDKPERPPQSAPMQELYASPNGDRWYLAYSPESQRAFVRHVPNEASGGAPSNIELAAFLSRNGNPPEKQALMRLIGAQAEEDSEPEGRLPAGSQGPHSPTD
jgi:hypothetical protein